MAEKICVRFTYGAFLLLLQSGGRDARENAFGMSRGNADRAVAARKDSEIWNPTRPQKSYLQPSLNETCDFCGLWIIWRTLKTSNVMTTYSLSVFVTDVPSFHLSSTYSKYWFRECKSIVINKDENSRSILAVTSFTHESVDWTTPSLFVQFKRIRHLGAQWILQRYKESSDRFMNTIFVTRSKSYP